jgi:nitrogen fixation protein FixH
MAILMAGFFGVVIAVNVGMATVSSMSWTGMVVENSYVAGQEFEQKRIAHEAQLALGWRADFSYRPGLARLAVIDGAGRPVDLGSVTLQVNRPVGGHDDQIIALDRAADGSYSGSLQLPGGVWDAHIVAPLTGSGPFELHQRLRVAGALQ